MPSSVPAVPLDRGDHPVPLAALGLLLLPCSSPLARPQPCGAASAHFTLPLTLLAAIPPNFSLLVSQRLRDAF